MVSSSISRARLKSIWGHSMVITSTTIMMMKHKTTLLQMKITNTLKIHIGIKRTACDYLNGNNGLPSSGKVKRQNI